MARQVKVILLETLAGIGKSGEEATVRAGFARNFLFPKRKALEYTPENARTFEEQRAKIAKEEEARISEAQQIVDALTQLTIRVNASTTGQLYGSVGPREIVLAARNQGGIAKELRRQHVLLSEPVREIGEHEVVIRTHPQVVGRVKVTILAAGEDES